METLDWEQGREQREKEAREEHGRLYRLFRENRFAFELERKRAIETVIQSAPTEEQREQLRALQASWDHRLKNSGPPENRFILAKTLFWDHFHRVWDPGIQQVTQALSGRLDQKK